MLANYSTYIKKIGKPKPEYQILAHKLAVEEFVGSNELAVHLGLTAEDFPMDMFVDEWLEKTQYVKYIRANIANQRKVSVDWNAGLDLLLANWTNLLVQAFTPEIGSKTEGYLLGYQMMQMGNGYHMPCMIFDEDENAENPFVVYCIEEILEGAAMATIIPELEKEQKQLLGNDDIHKSNSPQTDVTETPDAGVQKLDRLEKIRWMGKTPSLVYLFHQLQAAELIKDGNIGALIGSVFIDQKYAAISNKTVNKYLSDFRNLSKKPQGAKQIDELISLIKSLP